MMTPIRQHNHHLDSDDETMATEQDSLMQKMVEEEEEEQKVFVEEEEEEEEEVDEVLKSREGYAEADAVAVDVATVAVAAPVQQQPPASSSSSPKKVASFKKSPVAELKKGPSSMSDGVPSSMMSSSASSVADDLSTAILESIQLAEQTIFKPSVSQSDGLMKTRDLKDARKTALMKKAAQLHKASKRARSKTVMPGKLHKSTSFGSTKGNVGSERSTAVVKTPTMTNKKKAPSAYPTKSYTKTTTKTTTTTTHLPASKCYVNHSKDDGDLESGVASVMADSFLDEHDHQLSIKIQQDTEHVEMLLLHDPSRGWWYYNRSYVKRACMMVSVVVVAVMAGFGILSLTAGSMTAREAAIRQGLMEFIPQQYNNAGMSDVEVNAMNKAIRWLVHDDPMKLDPSSLNSAMLNSGSGSSGNSGVKSAMAFDTNNRYHAVWHRILNRYGLALLYFSTANTDPAIVTDEDGTEEEAPKGWFEATNWLTGASECDWFGVQCAGSGTMDDDSFAGVDIRILNLDLHENNLVGPIPHPLAFALRDLEFINFSHNELSGLIPFSLSTLSKLRVLHLGDNNLVGPLLDSLSHKENFEMKHMQILDFSHNKLDGTIPADYLAHLPSLQYLVLSDNAIKGRIPDAESAHRLLHLRLDSNFLTGKIPYTLVTGTPKLRELNVGDNDLDKMHLDEIVVPASLEYLDLSNLNLIGTIPTAKSYWTAMPNLQTLAMHGNALEGPIPAAMAKYLVNLRELYLQNNALTSVLPSALFGMAYLKDLKLQGNQLEGPIFGAETQTVEAPLETYYCGDNFFTGTLELLPQMTSLVDFRCMRNRWMDDEAYTGITGSFAMEDMPASLEIIELQQNGLTGPLAAGEDYNEDIYRPPLSLEVLNLELNFLTGQVPMSWNGLEQLRLAGNDGLRLEGLSDDFCSSNRDAEALQTFTVTAAECCSCCTDCDEPVMTALEMRN